MKIFKSFRIFLPLRKWRCGKSFFSYNSTIYPDIIGYLASYASHLDKLANKLHPRCMRKKESANQYALNIVKIHLEKTDWRKIVN